MKTFLSAMMLMIVVSPAVAQTATPASHDASAHDVYLNTRDLKWERLIPELGAGSPDITILHKDPESGATQLMIRSPANYHAPNIGTQPTRHTPLSTAHGS